MLLILVGDTIVDPFAGRMTRAYISASLGRDYVGYDVSPTTVSKVKEENKKIENDIIRRHDRYIMREGDYRKQIDDLQRELRVRLGYERDALAKNKLVIGVLD